MEFITIHHGFGKMNLANIGIKEDKNVDHFIQVPDPLMTNFPQNNCETKNDPLTFENM